MDFQDQTLTCVDCSQGFTWTASEQKFYNDKGFTNSPKRCQNCRSKKKAEFGNNRGGGSFGGGRSSMGPREMFNITCSSCGKTDSVPFKPKGDRPVLCRDCFTKSKGR